MNPSHVLVHVRAVLGLVIAVDTSKIATLARISVMPHHTVLRRKTMGYARTSITWTIGPAISVEHGSIWKNCYRIRRIERALLSQTYNALINQRLDISIIQHMWFKHIPIWLTQHTFDLEDTLIIVTHTKYAFRNYIKNLKISSKKHKKQFSTLES